MDFRNERQDTAIRGTSPGADPESIPAGVPFLRTVCKCVRCGRLVTAKDSVARGAGAKCWEHLHGQGAYARLEAAGQLRMPWDADCGAM